MLRGAKGLHGDALRARDGDIGSVEEVLFDDVQWTIRYLVVNTGGWLEGRCKVLIAPRLLGQSDWSKHVLNVELMRDEVETSPGVATNEPVSRQWETEYHDHFQWPYYWAGMGMSSSAGTMYPGQLFDISAGESVTMPRSENDRKAREMERKRSHDDSHLRSANEVAGYAIIAQDGQIGHVDDFILDDETWNIRYLAVDTRDLWPGKKVLLPPAWITHVAWPDRTVTVDVTRDQVRNAPEWDPAEPISPDFEAELAQYYTKQGKTTVIKCVGRQEDKRHPSYGNR